MRAMILAAGRGTRLRPLTDHRPKALVEIAGRTLLEITVERLRAFGVNEIIVNVHHFADMLVDYLAARRNFGIRIEVSREDELLDTGGGLRKASWFFLDDRDRMDEPFVLHNVDVLSTIGLAEMIDFHQGAGALATLAVQKRDTSRPLLFDDESLLCGWRTRDKIRQIRSLDNPDQSGFSGIHVISPRIFEWMTGDGAFSIIDSYLDLAAAGHRIVGFRADDYAWRDVGNLEDLERARRERER